MISVFVLLAERIVLFLLGDNWIEVALPLSILSLTIFFRIASRISDILVRATGRVYQRAWRRFIYAIIMIISTYIGQRFAGITGVAVGAVFSSFINFFLMGSLTFNILNIGLMKYLSFYFEGVVLFIVFNIVLLFSVLFFEHISSSNFVILFGSFISAIAITIPIISKYRGFFLKDFEIFFPTFFSSNSDK